MNHDSGQRRRAAVAALAKRPDLMHSYCRVSGCNHPPTAGTTQGLNRRFCKRHEDFYERHGSPYKRSYTAAELRPHRDAARKWLMANEGDHTGAARAAISAVGDLYHRAGRRIEVQNLPGKTPSERARAAWAALRDKGIHAREVVAVWLAVEAAIASDLQAETEPEFKHVQAAKRIHYMMGGTHKKWERFNHRGEFVGITELHRYSRSRGRVLRHIGEQLERAAGVAAGPFLISHIPAVAATIQS